MTLHHVARIYGSYRLTFVSTATRVGFTVFIPMVKEYILRRNRRIIVEKPEAEDYAFLSGAPAWKIHSCLGVKEMLSLGGEYLTVHESEIAHLRKEKKPEFHSVPAIGTQVRIASGPMASDSLTGAVTAAKAQQGKVQVTFGHSARLWVPVADVEQIT